MREKDFVKRVEEINGKVFLVGGWVRDMILGSQHHDKDYTICGVTEDNFLAAFPHTVKIGRSFPVFLLNVDGAECEVAFARRENKIGPGYRGFSVKTDSTVTIEEDLLRRDTTMNSMAYSPVTNEIIDPYGGRLDIKNKIVRATSLHFSEDPVRALRAARQAAQFGFNIEDETYALMKECGDELRMEATERVFTELSKALSIQIPSKFFRILEKAHLLQIIFPHLHKLIGCIQPQQYHPEGDAFEHTMLVLDAVATISTRPEVRFAALMHDIGKGDTPCDILPHHYGHEERGIMILKEINKKNNLPRKWYECAMFAIREHMRPSKMTQPSKVVDMLLSLDKNPLGCDGFAAIISADNNGLQADCLKNYQIYMRAIKEAGKTKIPSGLKGVEIHDWLREREINAFVETRKRICK
jgi:tRNA nucleotidyltransferase (CCA-adding enzyme)